MNCEPFHGLPATLSIVGDPRAVDELVRILHKDESDKIVLFHDRNCAARAFATMGKPGTLRPLVEALQHPRDSVRVAAFRALAGHDSRVGVEMVDNPDVGV